MLNSTKAAGSQSFAVKPPPSSRPSAKSSSLDSIVRVFNRWVESVKVMFDPRASRRGCSTRGASSAFKRECATTKASEPRCGDAARQHRGTTHAIVKNICFGILSKSEMGDADRQQFSEACDKLHQAFRTQAKNDDGILSRRESSSNDLRQTILAGSAGAPDGWFDLVCDNLARTEVKDAVDNSASDSSSEIRLLFKEWREDVQLSRQSVGALDEALEGFSNACSAEEHVEGRFEKLADGLEAMRRALRHAARPEIPSAERKQIRDGISLCLERSMPDLQIHVAPLSISHIRSIGVALGEIDELMANRNPSEQLTTGSPGAKGFRQALGAGIENLMRPGQRLELRMEELYDCLQRDMSPKRAPRLLAALVGAGQTAAHIAGVRSACGLNPADINKLGAPSAERLVFGDEVKRRSIQDQSALRDLVRQHGPELRRLLSVLNEGRTQILNQCRKSGAKSVAIVGELDAASRMLEFLTEETSGAVVPVAKDRKTMLSPSMQMALLNVFGLIVDSESGRVTSTHRFNSGLFQDWDGFVTSMKKNQLAWLNKAKEIGTSVLEVPDTEFHKDLSRCRFVIEGDVMSARAASKEVRQLGFDSDAQTQAGARMVEEMQGRLNALAEGDESFLALIAAFANQSALAVLTGGDKAAVNEGAWLSLQPGYSEHDEFFMVPSNTQGHPDDLTSVTGPSFGLTIIDKDHVRLEFSHDVPQADVVQYLDQPNHELLDPATSAWHGRYAVILGRDGSVQLDGPANVYGKLSILPGQDDLETTV